jgi:hypothetical protein
MDTNQLQRDKLNNINWIAEIQDASFVEKVMEILSLDLKPYKVSK